MNLWLPFNNKADLPCIEILGKFRRGEPLHLLNEGTHMHTGSLMAGIKIAFITNR